MCRCGAGNEQRRRRGGGAGEMHEAGMEMASAATTKTETGQSHGNMAWIPGGEFRMGDERFYPEERPVHRVALDGFWIDEHPVTVAEFRRFVKATGRVTLA